MTDGIWNHTINTHPKMDQRSDDWQATAEIHSAETGREICHLSRCKNGDAMVLVQAKALYDALFAASRMLPDGSPEKAVAEKVLADCRGDYGEEWCRPPTNLQWSAMMPVVEARRFLGDRLYDSEGSPARNGAVKEAIDFLLDEYRSSGS